jgi:hypothetical protein
LNIFIFSSTKSFLFIAKIREFPWAALIGYQLINGLVWQCGGTLISQRFVLTACVSTIRIIISFVSLIKYYLIYSSIALLKICEYTFFKGFIWEGTELIV